VQALPFYFVIPTEGFSPSGGTCCPLARPECYPALKRWVGYIGPLRECSVPQVRPSFGLTWDDEPISNRHARKPEGRHLC
ncbi:MAG: hypothetical protein WCC25_23005, partial [Candidatus Korobacteraceae bacterium]